MLGLWQKAEKFVNVYCIPFIEKCPDVNTDQDDLEIHCGEGACQPCRPGKSSVHICYAQP